MPQIRDGHRAVLKVPVRGLVAGADRRVRARAREGDARGGQRRVKRRRVTENGGSHAEGIVTAAWR